MGQIDRGVSGILRGTRVSKYFAYFLHKIWKPNLTYYETIKIQKYSPVPYLHISYYK